MDCVCGCGRDLPRRFSDHNYVAAAVALELLLWDKDRATRTIAPDGREALIARGVERYALLLGSLHGESSEDPRPEGKAWLEESAVARAGRSDLTERSFLGATAPRLSEEDMERLDRRHPESSFTGREDAAAPDPVADPPDADLVEKLERLGALRDSGVLTDDELTAAKARLLAD